MLKPSQGGRQALCFPMTQPLHLDGGVLPTMIDESQVVDLAASCEHDQDKGPSQHKPEGEQGLPVPVLQLDGPLQKKLKVDRQNQIGKQCSSPQIPTEFRVKWVKTASDLIPFVMDEASTIVHCGRTQMKVFTIDGHAEVMYFKGCHWDCPGHQKGHCGCHCHILQWHYNTR